MIPFTPAVHVQGPWYSRIRRFAVPKGIRRYVGVAIVALGIFGFAPIIAGAAVGDSGVPQKGTVLVFQTNLTPASVATIVAAEQTFTVTGLLVGDVVSVSPQFAIGTAVTATVARVSAANTLAIVYVNPTAGALVPTAGLYFITVLRG